MAMTLPALSRRISVSAPRPGPISTTVSLVVGWTASTIRVRMRRSVRKCWPRLLRIGGSAGSSRRRISAPKRDDRQVVSSRCVAGVLVEQAEDPVHDFRGLLFAMLPRYFHHLLLAQPVALAVARVADTVGEEEQHVSRGPWAARTARRAVSHAERRIERGQSLDLAALRNHERVRVSGVGKPQPTRVAVHHAIEH